MISERCILVWIDDELKIVQKNKKFVEEESYGLKEIERYENSLKTLKKLLNTI